MTAFNRFNEWFKSNAMLGFWSKAKNFASRED